MNQLDESLIEINSIHKEILNNLFNSYNSNFNFNDYNSILTHMNTFKKLSVRHDDFIGTITKRLPELDNALGTMIIALFVNNNKVMNFEKCNYLGLTKSDFFEKIDLLSNKITSSIVPDEALILLAKSAESQLNPNSIEYIAVRLLCVCKYLNIVNTSCYIATLIMLQEKVI